MLAAEYASVTFRLALGLLIATGCAQAREKPKPNTDLPAQVEAEIREAAAQADCAVSGNHCPRLDYGEIVAMGPYPVIVRLIEAGRACGASGGATFVSISSTDSRLFWKGIDGDWAACFQQAAIALGEAERAAVDRARSP